MTCETCKRPLRWWHRQIITYPLNNPRLLYHHHRRCWRRLIR